MKAQTAYFPSVDILRGFAALSVVVHHVVVFWNWQAFPEDGPLAWFRIGWLGVDLFFVISGFVIGLSAFGELDRRGAGGFRAPFWRRRLARIVPLHYLTCLVVVVFVTPDLLFHKIWPNAIAHALFVHNAILQWHGAINGVNWSLGVEMQFYVLMLLIAPWLRTARPWQIGVALVGIAWLWRFGAWYVLDPKDVPQTFTLWQVVTQLPGTLDEFAAGLLLARFVRSDAGRRFLAAPAAEPRRWLPMTAVLVALLWAVLAVYWTYVHDRFVPPAQTFLPTLVALACAPLVLFACCLNGPVWLRLSGPVRYLGTISYGIYLWHLPVIESLKRINGLAPGTALALTIGLTVLFAAVSWHFFEKPLIDRYARSKSRDTAVATA